MIILTLIPITLVTIWLTNGETPELDPEERDHILGRNRYSNQPKCPHCES